MLFKFGLLLAVFLIGLAIFLARQLVEGPSSTPPKVPVQAVQKKPVTVPESGTGKLITVPGSSEAFAPGKRISVRIQIEEGLAEALGEKPLAFAQTVLATLNDKRSWGQGGRLVFARTDGAADVTVLLATPKTSTLLCRPMRTRGRLSCRSGNRAVLNAYRWVMATPEFPDLVLYRHYLINHEVGHILGNSHRSCPGAGKLAPVMQQQTKRVAPCVPNAWPYL